MTPVNAAAPEAGYYLSRIVRKGPMVPLRIWLGFPVDPVTGETIERGWCWRAERAGEAVPIDHVWPWCARNQITEADYRHRIVDAAWCRAYAPSEPQARPNEPINPRTAAPIPPPGV